MWKEISNKQSRLVVSTGQGILQKCLHRDCKPLLSVHKSWYTQVVIHGLVMVVRNLRQYLLCMFNLVPRVWIANLSQPILTCVFAIHIFSSPAMSTPLNVEKEYIFKCMYTWGVLSTYRKDVHYECANTWCVLSI